MSKPTAAVTKTSQIPNRQLLKLLACLLVLSSIATISVRAQTNPPARLLIPIGGGYADVYAGFSQAVVKNVHQGEVKILVLPIPYATDPESISDTERDENLTAAENHRSHIEEACQQTVPAGVTCTVILVPILVRADALNPALLNNFNQDLSAIFILGGDPVIAMQVIGGTPVEEALTEAYNRGVIIAGTSAGSGLQSTAMIAGYSPGFTAATSLNFGAANVWHSAEQHGLLFGIRSAILDQEFFQRDRMGRLLNAITQQEVPHLGIGIDANTGVLVPDGSLIEDVFGLYEVAVLDAETYHAAEGVGYRGPSNTLSLRNVLVHLIPPGDFSYNLSSRQFERFGAADLAIAPPPRLERNFDALALPKGAGPLILAGNLNKELENQPVLERFVQLSGGQQAQILIVSAAYPSDSAAQHAAEQYAAALQAHSQLLVVSQKEAILQPPRSEDYTGVLFIAGDQSGLASKLDQLSFLKQAWLAGKPLLADDAASAVLGAYYSAHSPTPSDSQDQESATQKSFLKGNTKILPGLNFLELNIEPQVMADNRWGRLFSLAYAHPNLLSLGLNENSALELTAQGSTVLGDNAVFTLDLQSASLGLGTNQAYAIANGLLDVFAPGDEVKPEIGDIAASPKLAPTPEMATSTTTVTPTQTPDSSLASGLSTIAPTKTPKPTATPRPTATPPIIPPPANMSTTNLMVILAVFVVIIILAGILLNRRQII